MYLLRMSRCARSSSTLISIRVYSMTPTPIQSSIDRRPNVSPSPDRAPRLSCISEVAQNGLHLVQDGGIVDGGRNLVGLAVGDLPHGPAQHLARAGLGQTRHDARDLEARHGAHLLADDGDDLGHDLGAGAVGRRA